MLKGVHHDVWELLESSRTLVIVAHPDDEVIGVGGHLTRLGEVVIVHLTDGAPRDLRDARAAGFESREAYAAARRAELEAALATAGVPPERLLALGVIDQEAALALAPLARRLAGILAALRPSLVLTHPYEGGHPDHDATAFAVHAAHRLLRAAKHPVPRLVEMTFYHARGPEMAVSEFLPCPTSPVLTIPLSTAAREQKWRMRSCFATQQRSLAPFPNDRESFRSAPLYHFSAPPHPGQLFYERFPWGMTGERWIALAREALDALGLEEPL
jgi:LmbE family N-acetylglucosaminyl deacetylase